MNRILPLVVVGCFLAAVSCGHEPLEAQTIETNVADLHQQLKSGLKARRPLEFAYIARVVTMVENNQLPLDLVMSTFIWTRQNPQAKEYPFVYFQQALRERAKRIGITV